MATPTVSDTGTALLPTSIQSPHSDRLANAKTSIKYILDPKTGPQPTHLHTRALLRSVRYLAIFIFWRLVRYAKYAAVGALISAVAGTAIGSVISGAAFFVAPTGILGGAGVGVLWAVGKFGWRRAQARVKRRDGGGDARMDERADAEGEVKPPVIIKTPRVEPW